MPRVWEPDSDLVTGDGVVLELPVARLPTRALSFLVDSAVTGALFAAAALALGRVELSDAAAAAAFLTLVVVVFLGYPVAFDTFNRGRTPGRLALGLRAVRDDGGTIGFGQALVRGMGGTIDFVVTGGAGAVLSALFSTRDKRLGDRLAGTFVVRERAPRRPQADPVVVPSALSGWTGRSDLVGLDDDLAGRVRVYLDRRAMLTPDADARIGAQLAELVAARVTPPPPGTSAADYLAAVLAGRRGPGTARW